MKITRGMHANCSEWDSDVEADDGEYLIWKEEQEEKKKKEVLKELKGWDK